MVNIFNYLNYREFLADFYQQKKAVNSSYSFQAMANTAGFKSKSFIKLVIDGKKNLTTDSIKALNKIFKFGQKSFSYFEDLVAFNQAKSLKMRNYFFEKLSQYNKRNPGRIVLQSQYEFYSKWYHNTIRELVVMHDFNDDWEALAKMIRPSILPRQAKESVELLLRLGLLKKTDTGYKQSDPIVSTGDEVVSLAVQNFHVQNMALAAESIDTCPALQRDISCLVLGLSEQGMLTVKSEIQAFRKKLLQIAQNEVTPTRVYHVNFHMFPTSQEGKSESV